MLKLKGLRYVMENARNYPVKYFGSLIDEESLSFALGSYITVRKDNLFQLPFADGRNSDGITQPVFKYV